MVALQILNKVVQTHDYSIIEDNQLTEDYFLEYEDEYTFLKDHMKQYGNVPDKATFLAKFPDFDFIDVTESDRYLIQTIREEHLYYKSVPIVQQIAKLLKTDANAAAEYMIQSMRELQPNYNLGGTDIIAEAEKRYEAFIDRRDNQDKWFFTSGFPELDDVIHGIQRGEELFVIFARTNQGKSWILEKICTHIWEIGFNVGYISPEMGELSIGYRFDTLYRNFNNNELTRGSKDFDDKAYKDYVDELKHNKHKFMVATQNDFDRKITVSKLKKWVQQYKLDMIAVDGITYLSDERYKRGDNKTTSLTNISEDLMGLSMELGIPVFVVVQANRSGVVDKESEDMPELESIRDSDGISHNASIVLSIRQTGDGTLIMQVKKQRNGRVGDKIQYQWSPNIGEFIPLSGSSLETTREKKKIVEKEDVF
jgi:replicative DNA helicase